jgi:hypothetical protein
MMVRSTICWAQPPQAAPWVHGFAPAAWADNVIPTVASQANTPGQLGLNIPWVSFKASRSFVLVAQHVTTAFQRPLTVAHLTRAARKFKIPFQGHQLRRACEDARQALNGAICRAVLNAANAFADKRLMRHRAAAFNGWLKHF